MLVRRARTGRALLVLLLVATAWPAAGQQVSGPVLLWELSPGLMDDSAAQYVALFVDEAPGAGVWQLVPEDAGGDPLPTLALIDGAALAPGFVLLATAEAAAAYGLAPDFFLDQAALPTGGGGRLCLLDGAVEADCVGFGNVADNGTWGFPAEALLPGSALTRVNTTGENAVDWAFAPDLNPAQYLELQTEDDGGFADGGSLDGGDGGLFDGGDGGPFDGGLDGGDGGDGGLDGGPPTGGQEGDLPDGGVVVTPGNGTGGGGIGGGQVPEPDTGGCAVAGGSAATALLVVLLAARRRRR